MYTVQKKCGGETSNNAMNTVQKNCGVGKILNLYLKLALLQDLTFYACFTVEIPSPLTGTNWCPLRDKIRYEYMILHRQDG